MRIDGWLDQDVADVIDTSIKEAHDLIVEMHLIRDALTDEARLRELLRLCHTPCRLFVPRELL